MNFENLLDYKALKNHNFNPFLSVLQIFPSVPYFIFAVFLIPSFNVLSDIFMFHSNFWQFLLSKF